MTDDEEGSRVVTECMNISVRGEGCELRNTILTFPSGPPSAPRVTLVTPSSSVFLLMTTG